LPPLEVQRQIVDEIEGYRRIIDGARQVVEAWKPNLELELEKERKVAGVEAWETVKLRNICQIKGGKRLPKGASFAKEKTNHPYIRVVDMQNGNIDPNDLKFITQDVFTEIKNYTISKDDIYISIAGTIGIFGIIPEDLDGANLTENAAKIVFDQTRLEKMFLSYMGNSESVQNQVEKLTHAVGVPKLALERIRTIEIPLPPLSIQRSVVARIEAERQVIAANQRLIETYEEKIRQVIERVWEG
jgi:restriction endonuclease S subunit